MHLITNSWPQCKHMQGQRVKWLEQNLILLKSTLNSTLQLYTRFEHKWRNFAFLRVSFLYFFHSIFTLGSTPQTLVSAQWKGDLPTYHALQHCNAVARGKFNWLPFHPHPVLPLAWRHDLRDAKSMRRICFLHAQYTDSLCAVVALRGLQLVLEWHVCRMALK